MERKRRARLSKNMLSVQRMARDRPGILVAHVVRTVRRGKAFATGNDYRTVKRAEAFGLVSIALDEHGRLCLHALKPYLCDRDTRLAWLMARQERARAERKAAKDPLQYGARVTPPYDAARDDPPIGAGF